MTEDLLELREGLVGIGHLDRAHTQGARAGLRLTPRSSRNTDLLGLHVDRRHRRARRNRGSGLRTPRRRDSRTASKRAYTAAASCGDNASRPNAKLFVRQAVL